MKTPLVSKPEYGKPFPFVTPEWCDCPSFAYYMNFTMCGHMVSHRLYHLAVTKWPSFEIDVKLYGTKAVFIDRLETRGRGNSTFRYSAENPPPTYPSWVKRSEYPFWMSRNCAICSCYFDTGQVLCGIHEPHLNFEKAKLSGGLCRLGCDCNICKYSFQGDTRHWDDGEWKRSRPKERVVPSHIPYGGPKEHYFEDMPKYSDVKPGEFRERIKTGGAYLCPARTHAWVTCMAMTENSEMCTYCGGTLRA